MEQTHSVLQGNMWIDPEEELRSCTVSVGDNEEDRAKLDLGRIREDIACRNVHLKDFRVASTIPSGLCPARVTMQLSCGYSKTPSGVSNSNLHLFCNISCSVVRENGGLEPTPMKFSPSHSPMSDHLEFPFSPNGSVKFQRICHERAKVVAVSQGCAFAHHAFVYHDLVM